MGSEIRNTWMDEKVPLSISVDVLRVTSYTLHKKQYLVDPAQLKSHTFAFIYYAIICVAFDVCTRRRLILSTHCDR